MAIKITRGYQLIPEGDYVARITGIELEPNTSGDGKADILHVHFKISSGSDISKKVYLIMEEDTVLGEIVMAVNDGVIPDEIDDLEEFLVGKAVGIEVVHNTSKKTGKTYPNVGRVSSINLSNEYEDSDDTIYDDQNTELELEEEVDVELELDDDLIDDESLEIDVEEGLSLGNDEEPINTNSMFPQGKLRRKRAK